MTITHSDLIKRIAYSREGHEYDSFVTIDGKPEQYIGSAGSHLDAEKLCNDYAFNYYADNSTPEVAAQIAAEAVEATTLAWDGTPVVSSGGLKRWREQGSVEQARIKAAMPVDYPTCTAAGDCLDCDPRPAPAARPSAPYALIPVAELHALATTAPLAFRARLAALPESLLSQQAAAYAAYVTIIGAPVSPEATLNHFRRAIAVQRSCAEPAPVDDCAVIFELALTDPCALANYLRLRSDHQREQLAWRYSAWLKAEHGIERLPAYLLRGWAALLVSTAASGAA